MTDAEFDDLLRKEFMTVTFNFWGYRDEIYTHISRAEKERLENENAALKEKVEILEATIQDIKRDNKKSI